MIATILEATSLDDALSLAARISRCGVTATVPLPSGIAWVYKRGIRERSTDWPESIDGSDLNCVVIE